jgi:hypothetical protein
LFGKWFSWIIDGSREVNIMERNPLVSKIVETLRLRDPLWQGIGALAAILAIAASVFVAYDVAHEPIGAAQLTIAEEFDFDPLSFARSMDSQVALLVDGDEVESAIMYVYWISNTGKKPIMPDDYVNPIGVTVSEPWELLAIDAQCLYPPELDLRWTRVTTSTFILEPVLLNPGDEACLTLFAANPGPGGQDRSEPPEIKWTGRVANVQSLDVVQETTQDHTFSMTFYFGGLMALLVPALFASLFLLKVLIATDYRRLPKHTNRQQLLIVIISVMALLTTQVLLDTLTKRANWLQSMTPTKWVLIALEILLLAYLAWPLVKKRSRHFGEETSEPD